MHFDVEKENGPSLFLWNQLANQGSITIAVVNQGKPNFFFFSTNKEGWKKLIRKKKKKGILFKEL